MWAKVENDSVTKVYTRPTAITVGDVNYPQNIMQMWSALESEPKIQYFTSRRV